jgi:CO/xanthine dehydrogenase FAD-binding subunit
VKPALFEMHRPAAIEDALQLLSRHGDEAKVLAGGQSLVPLMNLRLATPSIIIDLGKIRSLRGIRVMQDQLVIGAMTRQADLLTDPLVALHVPLLHRAAEHIGHVQTRARGTVGGSLAHADPAAELPVAMVALGAVLTIQSVRGVRQVEARKFFKAALETELDGDEIVRDIVIPIVPNARVCFREYARRHGDFAIVSVAIQHAGPRTGATSLAVALGGVTPVPHLCAGLIISLVESDYDLTRLEAQIARELAALKPSSDIHASGDYRRHLASVLLKDGLSEILRR